MATHYRTHGFVIKETHRGETDQFFIIYTRDYGKLEIFGKAIRKISSKLRSGIGLFYLSEIEFIQGKSHKTLTDAILINSFPNIRKDLGRLEIAYRIAEVLDEMTPGEEKDEKAWQLSNEVFEKLNKLEIENWKLKIVYYYFFWHLVSLLGYQPELRRDSLGGEKIHTDIAKILKIIFKKDWQILLRLKLEPIHQKLLKNISEWYRIKIHAQ